MNNIPTIHIHDLTKLVIKLGEDPSYEKPYIFGFDNDNMQIMHTTSYALYLINLPSIRWEKQTKMLLHKGKGSMPNFSQTIAALYI